jgi:hypothetical protein
LWFTAVQASSSHTLLRDMNMNMSASHDPVHDDSVQLLMVCAQYVVRTLVGSTFAFTA